MTSTRATLVTTSLTLMLQICACSSSERTGGAGGKGGGDESAGTGGGAGAGAKGPSGGTTGTGGATGGTGMMASAGTGGGTEGSPSKSGDASASPDVMSSMSSGDGPPPASGDTWAKCGPESFKPGISAADFCAKYLSACGFMASGDGKSRYKSLEDCVAKYNALTDGPRGGRACVAYHLCVAGFPDTAEVFCPHAPEASAMTGPCKAAYL
jgi:hypothetical protein